MVLRFFVIPVPARSGQPNVTQTGASSVLAFQKQIWRSFGFFANFASTQNHRKDTESGLWSLPIRLETATLLDHRRSRPGSSSHPARKGGSGALLARCSKLVQSFCELRFEVNSVGLFAISNRSFRLDSGLQFSETILSQIGCYLSSLWPSIKRRPKAMAALWTSGSLGQISRTTTGSIVLLEHPWLRPCRDTCFLEQMVVGRPNATSALALRSCREGGKLKSEVPMIILGLSKCKYSQS